MGKSKRVVIGTLLLLVMGSGIAQTVPRIEDLDRAQGEGLVSRAEANAWQARADAESKRRAVGDGVPSLQMVVAVESSLEGTRTTVALIYPGGTRVEAGEGDVIPGGYKVGSINTSRNQVALLRGRETIIIGFGGKASGAGR